MLFLPESQRYLAKKYRNEEVKEVIKKIYPVEAEANQQYEMLIAEVASQRRFLNLSECQRYTLLFTTYKKCLFIGCMLHFFQQFIGINVVMYYGPDIILASGIEIDGIEEKERMAIILNIPFAVTNSSKSLISVFIMTTLAEGSSFSEPNRGRMCL
jgi:SP family xylose:H+ symportor-like MFS transporter